jgi:Pvc16 N-terminal domain
MKDAAIFNVTTALRDVLQRAVNAAHIPGSVFVGPLDDPDSSNAPLILLLYRIVPSAALRNEPHRVPTANGTHVDVFRNSLPLDLYYLVSVGTTAGSSEETLLKALGMAMQTLQGNPELTGAAIDHETVRVTLETLSTEEISRIWALFPMANYRTSIAYVASPVWLDPASPPTDAAPVIDSQLGGGQRAAEVTV